MAPRLTSLSLAGNRAEGNLSMLTEYNLVEVSIHANEGLCGMVPGGVRWASGFNPDGTELGKPCAGDDGSEY